MSFSESSSGHAKTLLHNFGQKTNSFSLKSETFRKSEKFKKNASGILFRKPKC